ncbi:MAG: site-2 protease family protein [Planctomycetota bacterium]
MFKTLDLGRVFGIDLRVHSTVPLLAGLFALLNLASGGPGAAASTLALLFAVALAVTLHELGHALTARLYGNPTHGITLYPFGGVAQLDHEARSSQEEVVVALAGPAVNVVLAALSALVYVLVPALPGVATFLWLNLGLAVFNLLPAFPMDGGRVLRGGLWRLVGYGNATRFAARAGQVFAVGFGLLGLIANPMLLVIAFFVFSHASAQLRLLDLRGGQPRGPYVDPRGRVHVQPVREAGWRAPSAPPSWGPSPRAPGYAQVRSPSGRRVFVVWRP